MSPEERAIFDSIVAIIRQHARVDVAITPEVRIAADLAIDSVEMLNLVMEIEEAFDISFPIEEASAIDTVGSLVKAIGRRAHA